tara:strand:+ start:699 stop:1301 length:603 start_codon:yes stop_codon:yes gene_type:complete
MQQVLLQHKYHHFGPYLAEMPVHPEYCAKLLKMGRKLKQSHRKNLAGQIEHEYLYPIEKEPWIFNEFQIYINTWIEGWKKFSNKPNFNPKYRLTQMWINKMKAKEYNPIHVHTNCDLSFVLWLQIPPRILKEAKNKETNASNPGNIGFLYGEDKWGVIAEKHFSPLVNTLMMFPADLRHQVMHFDSKVTRISVAGNIKFV